MNLARPLKARMCRRWLVSGGICRLAPDKLKGAENVPTRLWRAGSLSWGPVKPSQKCYFAEAFGSNDKFLYIEGATMSPQRKIKDTFGCLFAW